MPYVWFNPCDQVTREHLIISSILGFQSCRPVSHPVIAFPLKITVSQKQRDTFIHLYMGLSAGAIAGGCFFFPRRTCRLNPSMKNLDVFCSQESSLARAWWYLEFYSSCVGSCQDRRMARSVKSQQRNGKIPEVV